MTIVAVNKTMEVRVMLTVAGNGSNTVLLLPFTFRNTISVITILQV